MGFTYLPSPLAALVVKVSHLNLTLPSLNSQSVVNSDFAEMSLAAYAKLHTVSYPRSLIGPDFCC